MNAPVLDTGLELYYHAFFDLLTSRPMGMGGTGAIAWQTINDYAIFHELTENQKADMHYFITQMDSVYLEWMAEKQKQK